MSPPPRLRHTFGPPIVVESETSVKAGNGKNAEALTITWSDLPGWMKDNEYILRGYRRLVFLAFLVLSFLGLHKVSPTTTCDRGEAFAHAIYVIFQRT